MVIAKFKKVNAFAFNSYLDCRDVIVQTVRRAGIDIGYSQGFNPHELIYFSPPTSLGIESYCEYMYLVTNIDAKTFKELFNAHSPEGLQIEKAKNIEIKPDFYTLIDYAEYYFSLNKIVNLTTMNYLYKDEKGSEDISSKILSIKIEENILKVVMSCGQKANLKPSKLIKCLQDSYGIKIEKVEKISLFKKEDDNLQDIDKYIF